MKLVLCSVPAILLISTAIATADNTTAGSARPLMLGEVERTSFSDAPLTTERWYLVPLVAERSYAVYAWTPGVDPAVQDPDIAAIEFFGDALGTPATGVIDTADKEVRVELPGQKQSQASIIPDTGGVHWIRVSTSSTPTAAFDVDIVIVETTLFTPFWVVDTSANSSSYIEYRNTTDSAITVVLRAYDGTGLEVGVQPPLTLVTPANGSSYIDMEATMGAPAGFGSAQIAHTGPPGGVVANLTSLSAQSGLSFDTPFVPRMLWTPLGQYP